MLNKKKFLIIYFLLFLFSFNFNSNAQIVENVIINGNTRVSDETILIYGKIDIKKNLNEEKINNILNDLNSTNFFEDIKVEIKNNILVIDLKEYPVINQIILKGEPSNKISEEIKKNLKLKENNSFIKSYLSSDIEIIKQIYSSLGYNFASIETKINKIDNKNFDLLIEIIRGNKTKIASINFIGDKKLKDRKLRDIIASEEDKIWKVISRNTIFNQRLIDLDIRLLTNYYKSIGYYDVAINSKTAEINNENNINLTYSIDAGTRFMIDRITTNVDPVFDNKLFFPLKKTMINLLANITLLLPLKRF